MNVALLADATAQTQHLGSIQVIDLHRLRRGGAAPIRLAGGQLEQVCG
jgi:hypothetical protein